MTNRELRGPVIFVIAAICILASVAIDRLLHPREQEVLFQDRECLEGEMRALIGATSAIGSWSEVQPFGKTRVLVRANFFGRSGNAMESITTALAMRGWSASLEVADGEFRLCKGKYRASIALLKPEVNAVKVALFVKEYLHEPDCAGKTGS